MLFAYEAADKQGALVRGQVEAHDQAGVVEYLEKRDLIPIMIKATAAGGPSGASSILSYGLFERVTPLDQILFIRNLGASIKAGLNILEALEILIADATKKIMRTILSQAKANLENGQPLSETFRSFKKYFPPVFVGLLRAGEASGKLDAALDELSHHLSREFNLKRRVRSALAYPVLLIVTSIAVIVLLLVFVLPRLTKAFRQTGAELPFVTRLLVNVSEALTFSWILDAGLILAVIWFFTFFRRSARGQRFFLQAGFRIPVVRELLKRVALVRFCRTLGGLIGSGIPIVDALHLTADSVGNEYYRNVIGTAAGEMVNGVPLSKTLGDNPELFPRFLVSLVAIGERTGTMEHILKNLADFYDEEVDNTLKDLTNFIEPILLLFMGVVIGAIALSILLPIYRLVGKIG